jgi:hypothetical protein
MNQLRIRLPICGLVFAVMVLHLGADEPKQQGPSIADLAKKGAVTRARLERENAAWTAIHQLSQGDIHILMMQTPQMSRLQATFVRGETKETMCKLIVRDGFWYVNDPGGRGKYRPFEAPLWMPSMYMFLERSDLLTLEGADADLGEFVALDAGVATYQTRLPAHIEEQLRNTKAEYEKLTAERTFDENDPKTKRLRQQMSDLEELLKQGVPTKIDVESGILLQTGGPGKRVLIRNFRFFKEIDEKYFEIKPDEYEDCTATMLEGDGSHLALMGHAAMWEPGMPSVDTNLEIVNLKTGRSLRVPYPFGVSGTGCFSKDRRSVYLSGHVALEGALQLFEVKLETGETRRLGGDALLHGFTLFPTLSPDGTKLAVVHKGRENKLLDSQVFIVDISSGAAEALGKPMDLAPPTWLPDGKGLIVVRRRHKSLDQVPESTICRLDLNGEMSDLREGTDLDVLWPQKQILFRSPAGDMMACDLEGKNERKFDQEFPKFAFASSSRDGKELLVMLFEKETGPRPHIVELKTAKARPVPVGRGLWVLPTWR